MRQSMALRTRGVYFDISTVEGVGGVTRLVSQVWIGRTQDAIARFVDMEFFSRDTLEVDTGDDAESLLLQFLNDNVQGNSCRRRR